MFKSFIDTRLKYLKVEYISFLILAISAGFPTTNSNAQVYDGSVWLQTQAQVDAFNYTSITGSIRIDDQNNPGSIKNLNGLSNLTSVGGSLIFFWVDSLFNVDALQNLTTVGDFLAARFTSIRNLDGLSNVTSAKNVWLDANFQLTDIDGLSGLTTLDTLWVTWNNGLTNLDGFTNISGSVADLAVFRNSITTLEPLNGITSVADSIVIAYEPIINLDGLSNILSVGGNLTIFNNNLRSFCGLYSLLSNSGLAGTYTVYGNSYNPTAQQIIDCGPCSGLNVPTANAGIDQTVIVSASVLLNGSGSSDPDNNPLTYQWSFISKPFSSTAVLANSTTVSPTFTADVAGIFKVTLSVSDGCELSDTNQVVIRVITVQTATQDMTTTIQGLPLGSGNKNALTSKLQNALAKYNSGDLKAAKNILLTFINQVRQFVTSGYITQAQAQPLIDYANSIIAVINSRLGIAKETDLKQLPDNFSLMQNYPNPFNPNTIIQWQLPVDSRVTLKIYDVLGNEVAVLFDGEKPAGYYESEFNASKLASGIYFYKIDAGTFVQTKKMLLLK